MNPLGRHRVMLFAVFAAAVAIAGCTTDSSTVTTSTVTVTEPPSTSTSMSVPAETTRDFPVGPFSAVRLQAHYDLVVDIGSPASVRAEGDPEALDLLDIHTEGDTLVAAVKPNVSWPDNARVTVTATTPTLSAAALDGSGDLRIGAVSAETLTLEHGGSGRLEAPDLTVGEIRISSSGSGAVRAGGSADDADIRLAGSGKAELGTLTVKRAEVSLSGSGSLNLEATERVNGSLSGSGGAQITGGAQCSIASTGSGSATCT
ncbi:head GIN domain-containing protein [Mycolicibacterium sp. XJ1819]